jgi:GT2 family glycosyltransferase
MIYIIIPNYNGFENLKCVLRSLKNQTFKNYKAVIVDNGSSDESVKFVEENYKDIILIKNIENLGFSKAINTGIEYSLKDSACEFILLLNNDIELREDFIEKGIKTFLEVKGTDFIAVKMLNFFKRDFIDDTGNFIGKKGRLPLVRGQGEKDSGQFDESGLVFGACAGAAFYKAEIFKKVGLFDEDFFAYLEDVDLSFRLQLYGYKCYYNHEIICYHKRGETTNRFEGWEVYYSEKNLIALRLKNYPLVLYLKYSPLFFLARVKRYYKFLLHYPKGTFKYAFKGYMKGLSEIPVSLKKRKNIRINRKVSINYIDKIL